MSTAAFEFISHESFPEDEYTKEAVVICIEKKHRVTYVRKKLQTGAMFWDVASIPVKQNGIKKYLKTYAQDSSFLHEDIKNFLENRSWENRARASGGAFPKSAENVEIQEEFPF